MLSWMIPTVGIALALATLLLCALGHRLRSANPLASLVGVGLLTAVSWQLALVFTASAPPLDWLLLVAWALALPILYARPDWNPIGHLAAVATLAATGALMLGTVVWIAAAAPGPLAAAAGLLFLTLQLAAVVTVIGGVLEMIEACCVVSAAPEPGPVSLAGRAPRVSIHVPIHNEPPGLVIDTLKALARLDYPDFEVLVVDNNTRDEALWRPVEAYCRSLGERFRFFHLDPWPGYKSGALNFALRETDPEAEIIGIVDADYQVEPGYLRDLAGYFADEQLAFVQTPQDYRDLSVRSRFGRALYFSYLYFFKISMAWRNRYNAIIFAGTMGLIRRRCLEEAGGWDECCVTEDAELSLRLLDAGYRSVFVDRSYGRGLMPLDYAGLKRQRFRWAFGGMQLLRLHWKRLLFPSGSRPRGGEGKLTGAQRLAYLLGGIQWLSDPITLCFSLIVLVGWAVLEFASASDASLLENGALLLAPILISSSLVRFAWALRARSGCCWRDAMDGLALLLSLSWTTSIACLEGLFRRRGAFLRTPKSGSGLALAESLRVVTAELLVSGICIAGVVSLAADGSTQKGLAPLAIALLLLWNGVVYLSAVQASLWSHVEITPEAGEPAVSGARRAAPTSRS
jgi:glycosyltransferase involved in cell wall biosynthesis